MSTDWTLAEGIRTRVAVRWESDLRRAGHTAAADMVARAIDLRKAINVLEADHA